MALKEDSESTFLRDNSQRTTEFKRNSNLEALLEELAQYLEPIESEIEKRFTKPTFPPLFLVGNPRSGTSLFMQFLSATNAFAVPTNLLSRFYYAPYLGAKIQELTTNPKYDYKNQLGTEDYKITFNSVLGGTHGKLSPSEILHFWRLFLPRYDPQYLNENECGKIDVVGLRKGIAAIESVFEKPFAAKAFMLQYNLDWLIKAFPNCIIVYLKREPIFVMQSILKAREIHYGDRQKWWSVKPQEYEFLKEMDPYHQIAGQVYYTDKALEEQLTGLCESKKLEIKYEDFCLNPRYVAASIKQKYFEAGFELQMNEENMISQFEPRNEMRGAADDLQSLEKAYQYFVSLST